MKPDDKTPHAVHEPPPGASFMNTVRWVLFGGLLLLALVSVGSFIAYKMSEGRGPARSKQVAGATIYRCPMHPNYTSDKPGECPICGMNLEQVELTETATHAGHDGGVPGLTTVQIPSARTQLIGVRLARAERGGLGEGAPLVGFVSPDETRLRRVQLRVSGWVQNVTMNRTGERVTAGQPMLSIYSPELYQIGRAHV